MLTYAEAWLFLRAGDDMRFAAWPQGDFVRMVEGEPRQIEGYDVEPYVPTSDEQTQANWRRA